MKVLIIEDDPHKAQQLASEVAVLGSGAQVELRTSYQSGLRAVMDWVPQVILLDMTMPTFDEGGRGGGGRPRPFAGRDILFEMKRRSLQGAVIVVTQFERFGEGPQRQSRSELEKQLASQFSDLFRGMVYYNPVQSDWKLALRTLLGSLGVGNAEPSDR